MFSQNGLTMTLRCGVPETSDKILFAGDSDVLKLFHLNSNGIYIHLYVKPDCLVRDIVGLQLLLNKCSGFSCTSCCT